MLKVRVQVPEQRDRAGFVEIEDGFATLSEGVAAATSGFSGEDRGRDHPPLGRYELTARAETPGGAETEYGAQVLLFEPIAGPALEAESYGRFGVLLYAGSAGSDSLLRRTQGGVRLSRRSMEVLLAHVRDDTEVELHIETLAPIPWWAFWRKRRTPPSLSRDPPRLTAPPYDEATIAARLLQSAIRRSRRPRREEMDDRDRWPDRDPSSSRESGSEFRGGGGTGGGGGASGSWTDAPAAGRGPGVNAAGVVLGAASVAAVAAAMANERESATGEHQGAEPSISPSGVGSSADAGSSGDARSSGDAASSADSNSSGDSSSGSSGTTTSTSY